jgi:hypothetical protein
MSEDNYNGDPFESVAAIDLNQRHQARLGKRTRVLSGQFKIDEPHTSAISTHQDANSAEEDDFDLDKMLVLKRD